MPGAVTITPSELRLSPLFSGWEPGRLQALLPHSRRLRLSRGDYAWHEGDVAGRFSFILAGLIKISRTAAGGEESIMAIFGPRESIGDTAVVRRGPYPADAIVLSPSAEILQVEAGPVLGELAAQPRLANALNDLLLRHTRALEQKIHIMTAGPVPKRLAMLFLLLAQRFGDLRPDGMTLIPIRLSRAEIAGLVGVTVETVIRALSQWRVARVVLTTPNGQLAVDRGRLLNELRS